MRLITADQFSALVTESGCAGIAVGRVVVVPSCRCYETDYAPSGIVGADLSEIMLNQIVDGRISSGILQVVGVVVPDSKEQGAVISYILSLLRYENVPIREFRFEFDNDYLALVSVMSWCLACGWVIDFMSTRIRFGMRTEQDEVIAAFWDNTVVANPRLPELLINLQFSPSNSCFRRGGGTLGER